ncbi:MAG: NAD(+)/NADH kinase [Ignavibacteriaceae bacterium]|jgi:NAD+ kinase|nr:NAD(+)/NADH kinase [Ignavibacteriaceae bacterium]
MKIGIIANTAKDNVFEVVSSFINKLKENGLDYYLSESLNNDKGIITAKIKKTRFLDDDLLCRRSDMIVSIGGDGTMLSTAYHAIKYNKPVLGVNLGKLGFLVETNINQMDVMIDEIKNNQFTIEERMVITGICTGHKVEKLFAVNDIVIDKGGWPKMIDITMLVDGEYVTTFAADGIIAATPTGSTGYSISTGGPIVSPRADVITLSPISPHSLTVKPIVLPSDQKIVIRAASQHKKIQVNCDGQRVYSFTPPIEIKISRSEKSLKLIHTSLTSYFETLRNKLLWGIDLRRTSINK